MRTLLVAAALATVAFPVGMAFSASASTTPQVNSGCGSCGPEEPVPFPPRRA